jgi:dipeptidyl aminopeptidase/acylaminoacyl peptidase
MNSSFRKFLVLGIVIAGIIAMVIGIFTLFGNRKSDNQTNEPVVTEKQSVTTTTNTTTTSVTNSPSQSIQENIGKIQQSEKIKALSDRPVLGISLNKEGNRVVYYDKETGQGFRINFDGKIWERISDTEIRGLSKITWAPTRDKVIVENQDGKTASKYIYDYNKGQKHSLDGHIGKVVFSPDGQRILYHYWDPQKTSNVAIANYDGSHWQSLFPSDISGLELAWPKVETVSFLAPEGAFYGATLYFAKLDPPYDPKTILEDKFGLKAKWSDSGRRLLYSYQKTKDSTERSLYVRNFDDETESNLNFSGLPEKCVWAQNEKSLYCAEATKSLLNIIPADYQKKLSLSGDSFWKIDLDAQEVQEVYIPKLNEKIYDASELIVADGENYLFFVNKLDGKLYSLSLQ